MSIRDRLDTLSRAELGGLAIVVVVTLAGAGLWYSRSLPRGVQIVASSPQTSHVGASSAPQASATSSDAGVIVDVAGWVEDPGVYQLAQGQRVVDALKEAGGARKGADLSSINLAAVLVDGSQILIPKKGAGSSTAGGTAGGSGAAGGAALVNINTADETQLETLNGIGPVLASSIVQYRTEHGPFNSVDDLDNVSGIGPATLEKLRPFVTI
jgi:competence protein ComEA